ncbi:hypothetical protein JCM31826_14970 [Thermaurantimonas aggregans]|uniref:Uncharacterized protein n=1 Tax=Thermaurantimonas aggregans TaxID=2173829 RepID=A0A401XLW3_9FLAO|nr:hypothetical protein JCM31826_14970 [Thermaurantimonas aggregans]
MLQNGQIRNLLCTIKLNLPKIHLDPALSNVANIFSRSRNTAIHYNEVIPIPSRDQNIMVTFAMREFVRQFI